MSLFAVPALPTLAALGCAVVACGRMDGATTTALEKRTFNLPRGDAASTLKEFSAAARTRIVYLVDRIRGVTTNAVQGEFTPRQALEMMLAGSILEVSEDAATGALLVSRRRTPDASPRSAREDGTDSVLKTQTDPAPPMKRPSLLRAFGAWLAVAIAPLGAADGPGGVVTGRILNPVTGEYLRNAEVRVVGGPTVASEEGGTYRLSGVGPGEVTLEVAYTGFRTTTAVLRVPNGETITRDFQLTSALQAMGADGMVKLDAFVVSSQREGNAKAIMEQRASMNITNSVSSDVFGEVAEGNVGEFLKHLPGVNYDSLDGTVRYISLRGMGTEYAGVTVDGMSYPSANAEGVSRGFSFEQVSLSAMESIEVSKTVSADVDASSPAGTVNLKTKRAFDRAGRRVSASFSLTAQSDQLTLGRTYGPGDERQRKLFPSGQFEYSDLFLHRRLGIVFGLSESNSYIQRAPTTMTYNYTPTAASPAPVALTAIRAQEIYQTVERFATSVTADFKATPYLVLSLNVMYNHSDVWSGQRAVTVNTGARTTPVAGPDGLTDFTTTATNGSIMVEPQGIAKVGNGYSYSPRAEFTRGNLTVEGRAGLAKSVSGYDPMKYRDSVFSSGIQTLNNVRFTAARSGVNAGDWNIRQISGGDWNDGALYAAPAITLNDGRYADDKLYSGEGLVTLRTHRILPVVWKAGIKWKREVRDYQNSRSGSLYNYTGLGAGVGAWRAYRSPLNFDFGEQGLSFTSATGNGVFLPNIMQIADTFRSHPEYFASAVTATDYYNAVIANQKEFEEEIRAGFLMATTKLGRLNLRAGLRREETETDSLEFDALPSSAVTAAGFAISGGRATTIPGLQYQYLSRPPTHRRGQYDHLFPSASLKYNLTRTLDLQVGYSRTIKRPAVASVAGVWVINDDTLTITAPNVNLKPELSNNYSVRLVRYFEPTGLVAVNFFQNDIKGLHLAGTRISGADFNPGDTSYEGYTFVTTGQSADNVRVRGLELEFNQSLTFLPGMLKGLGIRGSYTRNYAQVIVADMTPHLVTGGLSYGYRRVSLYANMNWASSRPTNATGSQYQRHRVSLDTGGSYRLTGNISAFFSVRNVLNDPFIRMEKVGNNPDAAQFFQKFGVTPSVGVRATF